MNFYVQSFFKLLIDSLPPHLSRCITFLNFLLHEWLWFFVHGNEIFFVHLEESYKTFHPPTWRLLGVAFKIPNIRLCRVTNSRAILVIQNNLGTPWVGYLVHKLLIVKLVVLMTTSVALNFLLQRKVALCEHLEGQKLNSIAINQNLIPSYESPFLPPPNLPKVRKCS